MYPEMVDEFGKDAFPATSMHIMTVDPESDENRPEYILELEYPYGSYTHSVLFKEIDKEG